MCKFLASPGPSLFLLRSGSSKQDQLLPCSRKVQGLGFSLRKSECVLSQLPVPH